MMYSCILLYKNNQFKYWIQLPVFISTSIGDWLRDRRQKTSYPHFTTIEFIEINNIATFLIVIKHQMRHNSSSGVANENDRNKEIAPIIKNSISFKVELISFKLNSKVSGNTLQIFEGKKVLRRASIARSASKRVWGSCTSLFSCASSTFPVNAPIFVSSNLTVYKMLIFELNPFLL